ncbi:MAG: ThuA domain-containing protein [Planctomycetota bacterium]
MLTQSMGFKHSIVSRPLNVPGALSLVESTLTSLGLKSGVFEAECTQDATIITPEKLKELDALIFYTTGDLPIRPAAFTAVQNWLRGGKAFVGIHSATDTFKEYRPYYELLGATYLRHPWNRGATITNLEPGHSAVKMFPAEFAWNDELCEHQNFDPKKVRVLLSVNTEKSSPKLPKMIPLCWVRDYGKGRMFYTNLGNGAAAWNDAMYQAHILGGLRWALKLDEGSAEPNPETSLKQDAKARLTVLETQKSWLTKAAKSSGIDPAIIIAAATKTATDDKAAFTKLHDAISDARAIEEKRETALKPKQRPSDADVKSVLSRRNDIITMLTAKKVP